MKLITGIVTAAAIAAATSVSAGETQIKKSTQTGEFTIGGLGTGASIALVAGGLLTIAVLINQGSSSTTTTTTTTN